MTVKRPWLEKPIVKGGFDLEREARSWGNKKELELDAVREGGSHDMPFDYVIDYYIEHGTRDLSAIWRGKVVMMLERWKAWIGDDRPISQVGMAAIRGMISDLEGTDTGSGQGMRPTTIRHHAKVLKRAISFAVKDGLVDRHPITSWDLPAESPPRNRVLTRGPGSELESLMKALDRSEHWIKDMFLIAIATGARRTEVGSLRRRNIDLEHRCIRLEKTKSGLKRPVPILGFAIPRVTEICEGLAGGDFLFPGEKEGQPKHFPKAVWERVRIVAGIQNYTWHDIRHCYATWLLEDHPEVTLVDVQKILGHQSYRTTERIYVHLRPETHILKVAALSADFGVS